MFSWTDCKSQLDKKCKTKSVCVFFTLAKSMSKTNFAKKLLSQNYTHKKLVQRQQKRMSKIY